MLTGYSDYTGNHTKLSKILLNGNNICMVGNLVKFTVIIAPNAMTVDSRRRWTWRCLGVDRWRLQNKTKSNIITIHLGKALYL